MLDSISVANTFQESRYPENGSILVLGAGELGMAVLSSLAGRISLRPEVSLTVLLRPENDDVRDPVKNSRLVVLQNLGIHIVFGNLISDSVEELARQFAAFDVVIGCTGFVGGGGTQMRLARAALDAGVKKYIPWQFGVDYDLIGRGSAQDLFDEQLEVRDLLRSQTTTKWLIISTGMFTSFLFEPSFGVVDLSKNAVHALGSWDNAVTITTAEDIGNLTAEIFFVQPKLENRVIYTAGDTITYRYLADSINSLLHRRVERVTWTVAELKKRLAADPNDALAKYRVVFAEGRGVAWPKSETFNAQRELPVVDLQQWIQEHLASSKS